MLKSNDDTIVAIATPLGEGGLGVVRLSGATALQIADRVFECSEKISQTPTHTLRYGHISRQGETLDQAMASVFRAPRSYTGEDVVEFSCHGSPIVLKEVVNLCLSQGARLAEPGEFTQRAYLNGKVDLMQAEAVAALIHAQSTRAAQAAADQLNGRLSSLIKTLRQSLIDVLARIEANLDFVEEDIPGLPRGEMDQLLRKLQADLGELLDTSVKGRQLRQGIRVALLGRPNVGKSSLFNALLGQDRAIVTPVPGTTRDTLEENIEWDGYPVVLVDTAGLRQSKDEIELLGTERARRAHESADVLLFVVDGSEPFNPEDAAAMRSVAGRPAVTAFNKSDRGLRVSVEDFRPAGVRSAVSTSATMGAGLSELKSSIVSSFKGEAPEVEGAPVVTNLRHVENLEGALRHIHSARKALSDKQSEELISIELRAALEKLGALTGESLTDEVLDSIFRQFCVGK